MSDTGRGHLKGGIFNPCSMPGKQNFELETDQKFLAENNEKIMVVTNNAGDILLSWLFFKFSAHPPPPLPPSAGLP